MKRIKDIIVFFVLVTTVWLINNRCNAIGTSDIKNTQESTNYFSTQDFNKKYNVDKQVLVIAGDYWCPYNCFPDDEEFPGYLVELMRRALYIYRIDVEYRMISWGDALDQVKRGEIDGVIGISNVEGLDLITTRLPLEYSISRVFTKADNTWMYDGIESLHGKKLGIIQDYIIDAEFNHYIGVNYSINPGIFVVENSSSAIITSLANLIDGDADIYIGDQRVVNKYINENGLKPYIKDAGVASSAKQPLYIALSSKNPNAKQYIKLLEEGLASLKATGEYDDLRLKYNMNTE